MKSNTFDSLFRVLAIGILLAAQASGFAQVKKSDDYPPVERASFHQRIFADEDMVVLNNAYPPGGDSGFHAHYHDMFYVVIQPPEGGISQKLGGPEIATPKFAAGTAAFGSLGGEPTVHRVVNGDKRVSQFIVVELLRTRPRGSVVSSREASTRYTQITDNARLRAWRLVLEPGESAATVSQVGKGIRVVVRGGLLSTRSPGYPDQVLALRTGEFAVQTSGFTRALANAGSETIELVEMELK